MSVKFTSIFLLAFFLIVIGWSFYVINADYSSFTGKIRTDIQPSQNLTSTFAPETLTELTLNTGHPSEKNKTLHEPTTAEEADAPLLPIPLKLLGTDEIQQVALLEYEGDVRRYELNSRIFEYDIFLLNVQMRHVIVEYEDKLFELALDEINLLQQQTEKSKDEFLSMTPSEIGTRPRILEHIVTLKPSQFIVDGMIVSEGLNPSLFAQAGLKEDDVLKKVNGLDIMDSDDMQEIQNLLKTETSLELIVQRRGKTIRLYLDIPSESLEFTN